MTAEARSFGREVREELAHVPVDKACCRRAETAALLRFGGALHLGSGGVGWVLSTGSAAVARRTRAALDAMYSVRPEIEVHQAGGLRHGTGYRLAVPPPATALLTDLGLLDSRGRPAEDVPFRLVRNQCCAASYVRGAFMAGGSLADPRHDVHLEIRAPAESAARSVARLVERLTEHRAGINAHSEAWRVVLKAGAAIGTLLTRIGAHTGFLRWDGERLRRELRGDANRMANADRANLERSVVASVRQIEAAERLLASPDWDELAPELREAALARLANPEASLAELGGLLDPPVGKSAVYRRLARVVALAEALGRA